MIFICVYVSVQVTNSRIYLFVRIKLQLTNLIEANRVPKQTTTIYENFILLHKVTKKINQSFGVDFINIDTYSNNFFKASGKARVLFDIFLDDQKRHSWNSK